MTAETITPSLDATDAALAAATPGLDDDGRRLAAAVLRLLSAGELVPIAAAAAGARMPASQAEPVLRPWVWARMGRPRGSPRRHRMRSHHCRRVRPAGRAGAGASGEAFQQSRAGARPVSVKAASTARCTCRACGVSAATERPLSRSGPAAWVIDDLPCFRLGVRQVGPPPAVDAGQADRRRQYRAAGQQPGPPPPHPRRTSRAPDATAPSAHTGPR